MSWMWSGFGFYFVVFCCFEESIYTRFLATYCLFCFNGKLIIIFLDHPFLSLRTSHFPGMLWRSQAHHLTPTRVKHGSGLKQQWMFSMVDERWMRNRTRTQRRGMFENWFLSKSPNSFPGDSNQEGLNGQLHVSTCSPPTDSSPPSPRSQPGLTFYRALL